jgi:hypothetical protein
MEFATTDETGGIGGVTFFPVELRAKQCYNVPVRPMHISSFTA